MTDTMKEMVEQIQGLQQKVQDMENWGDDSPWVPASQSAPATNPVMSVGQFAQSWHNIGSFTAAPLTTNVQNILVQPASSQSFGNSFI